MHKTWHEEASTRQERIWTLGDYDRRCIHGIPSSGKTITLGVPARKGTRWLVGPLGLGPPGLRTEGLHYPCRSSTESRAFVKTGILIAGRRIQRHQQL